MARTTLGLTVRIDYERLGVTSEHKAFRALLARLSGEDSLEVTQDGSRIYFRNPWTWNVSKWNPFSAIDAGSIEVFEEENALAVHYELSLLRPLMIAIVFAAITVLPFILADGNLWLVLGCLFPYWLLIFAVNIILLLQLTRSVLHAS